MRRSWKFMASKILLCSMSKKKKREPILSKNEIGDEYLPGYKLLLPADVPILQRELTPVQLNESVRTHSKMF